MPTSERKLTCVRESTWKERSQHYQGKNGEVFDESVSLVECQGGGDVG